jgi:hypothetical protein
MVHASMKRSASAFAAALLMMAVSALPAIAQAATTAPPTSAAITAAATTPATTAPDTTAPVTTAPDTTAPVTTAPVTTAPPTTPATTAPALTTTTSAVTTTTSSSTSTTTAASSSVSGTRIAVIVIIVVVGLALIAGLYFLFARNRQRTQWSAIAQEVAADALALSTAVERGLPLLRNPTTAAQVWVDLNSRAGRVRAGLRSLATAAPDQRASAAATRTSQALESLLSTIDTDRGLRMGPPQPGDEQIAYSEALLSQRAVELGRAAHDLESVASPPA